MEPGPLTEICIPGKLSVVVEVFVKQSLRPWLPAWHQQHKTCTCVHAVCRDARRKMYVDFDNQKHQPCSGGWRWLLPPTVSELSQYVHSRQLSPEEHHHPDERERETVNCEVQHCQVSEDQTPQSVVSEDQGMRHDTNQYSDNTMCQNTDVQMEL